MQVSQITSVGFPDEANAIPSSNGGTHGNGEPKQVTVESRHRFSVGKPMQEHDDIAPAIGWPPGVNDFAVSCRVNWIPEVGIRATDPVDVFAEMTCRQKWLRIISQRPKNTAHRRIEPGRLRRSRQIERSRNDEGGIKRQFLVSRKIVVLG